MRKKERQREASYLLASMRLTDVKQDRVEGETTTDDGRIVRRRSRQPITRRTYVSTDDI